MNLQSDNNVPCICSDEEQDKALSSLLHEFSRHEQLPIFYCHSESLGEWDKVDIQLPGAKQAAQVKT